MSKKILLSDDDITYYLLPGSSGDIALDGKVIEDTIFGQTYKSGFTGPIAWAVTANAVYKGFPGYVATVKKPGVTTTMTGEAMTLVSGKTYQVTNAAHRILNRAASLVVSDNAIDHTVDVLSVDFLFGLVTFRAAYTVTGPITLAASYFPTVDIGNFTAYTLTQTANAINNSDIPTLKANGGFETFQPGLKSVKLDLPAVYDAADGWHAAMIARAEYIIEVNPDGTGAAGSIARGFFRLLTDKKAGNVGALEEETLSFELNVPMSTTGPDVATPFSWAHGTSSPIPTAIKKALTQFLADLPIHVEYLSDGTTGWKGSSVITNLTLTGGMETANSFAITVQGSDAPIAVP